MLLDSPLGSSSSKPTSFIYRAAAPTSSSSSPRLGRVVVNSSGVHQAHRSSPIHQRKSTAAFGADGAMDAWAEDDDADNHILFSQQGKGKRNSSSMRAVEGPSSSSRRRMIEMMRQMPWNGSQTQRESIADYFKNAFRALLSQNEDIFASFLPFLLPKVAQRCGTGEWSGEAGEAATRDDRGGAAPILTATDCRACRAEGFQLRPYQIQGVQFLLNHFHSGMGCILGDDMGLGKTAQTVTFLQVLFDLYKISGPHLIIVPLTAMSNWLRELERWAPSLAAVKYHGQKNERGHVRYDQNNRFSVFVTTIATFCSDSNFFRKRQWVSFVIDEAHCLKNEKSNITHQASKVSAVFRLALTGTPLQNDAGELRTLISVLFPKICSPSNSTCPSSQDVAECTNVLRLVMLRRVKSDIADLEIPPKVEEPVLLLEPTLLQSLVLEGVTKQLMCETDSDARGAAQKNKERSNFKQISMSVALARVQCICNSPMTIPLLLDSERKRNSSRNSNQNCEARLRRAGIRICVEDLILPSAKMMKLDLMLQKYKEKGHHCIIFSSFTCTLDLLEGFCMLRGYIYERLDGSTPRIDRELSIRKFNAPTSNVFLFLVTTSAGGVGISLIGADRVILFDPHYNPQVERQAIDRAHRIGQRKVVHVERLCVRGTVEERIKEVALRKAKLSAAVIGCHSNSGGIEGATDQLSAATKFFSTDELHQLLFGLPRKVLHRSSSSCSRQEAETEKRATMLLQTLHSSSTPGGPRECAVPTTPWQDDEGRNGLTAAIMIKDTDDVEEECPVTRGECFLCREPTGESHNGPAKVAQCSACDAQFHAECLENNGFPPERRMRGRWNCPRHYCSECDKQAVTDGGMMCCRSCLTSYCIDCLPQKFFDLDLHGEYVYLKRFCSTTSTSNLRTFTFGCDACAPERQKEVTDGTPRDLNGDEGVSREGSPEGSSSSTSDDDTTHLRPQSLPPPPLPTVWDDEHLNHKKSPTPTGQQRRRIEATVVGSFKGVQKVDLDAMSPGVLRRRSTTPPLMRPLRTPTPPMYVQAEALRGVGTATIPRGSRRLEKNVIEVHSDSDSTRDWSSGASTDTYDGE